jgi:CHAD domain-containing protein
MTPLEGETRPDPTMNKPHARPTAGLLQRRARELKRHLPAAMAGNDHSVHQARVATRRLREAVPVLARGLKHSKAAKASRKIRRLTRALGGVREVDVTLHLLDELAAAGELPRTSIEDVRAHVVGERDRRRVVMLERLEHVNVAKLGRRLVSVAEALEASTDESWRDVLGTRLLKRARILNAAMDAAGLLYVPERLLGVRIAAKKLRYALELAGDGEAVAARPHVRTIKRVQDLLGRLHDLQILQAHIAEVQAGSASDRPGMQAALDALARHVEDACRLLHARYLTSAPRLREVCEAIPKSVLPQLEKPRPRRALKMALARKTATAATGGR